MNARARPPAWWPTTVDPRTHLRAAETQLRHAGELLHDQGDEGVSEMMYQLAVGLAVMHGEDW